MTIKKKTEPAPAAAKAESKPAMVAAATPTSPAAPAKPERPAPIMSADHIPQTDPGVRTPARRGPQTGMSTMSDADYVSAFGDKAELHELRGRIEERRAAADDGSFWQRCNNAKCQLAMKVRAGTEEGGSCIRCNWQKRKDLGRMFKMDDAAVKAHLAEEARKGREADERIERASLYRKNTERGLAGLRPLSLEEYRALRKAERQDRAEADRQLASVADVYRPRMKR